MTSEQDQWMQNPNAVPQDPESYHPVLPHDPEKGIPWTHVRPPEGHP